MDENPEADMTDLNMMKCKLLTKKEQYEEKFIHLFMNEFDEENPILPGTSADLVSQEQFEKAQKKLSTYSLFLGHRYKPVVKEILNQRQQQQLNRKYGVIKAKEEDPMDMAKKYKKCFNAFVNAVDDVSFRARDVQLLKNIDIRDEFTLIFFAMNTTQRQKGDNVPQLIVSGETSTGSLLTNTLHIQ